MGYLGSGFRDPLKETILRADISEALIGAYTYEIFFSIITLLFSNISILQ